MACSEKSILLIEDEQNILEALSFILRRAGWIVYTHSNGNDANEVINKLKPAVVVLDIMLPGKSGFDVLRDLRSSEVDQKTPVMILTARGQEKDRDAAKILGADLFMTKPFVNSEVLNALEGLFDNE
ncbi:MAG: response regulator [Paracoccaceae bacterium]|jgi:DNA-binding response OmpR family regulator|nr:response regulator [Rhodobacterales bacterium]